jgi:hypothetical protein
MPDRVKLNELQSTFAGLDYPVTRAEAAATYGDVTLVLADGEANLGRLISEAGADAFDDPEDLFAELNNTLPLEAVGEPGQSEGDA